MGSWTQSLKAHELAETFDTKNGRGEDWFSGKFRQSLLHASHGTLRQDEQINLVSNASSSFGYEAVVRGTITALSGSKGAIGKTLDKFHVSSSFLRTSKQ